MALRLFSTRSAGTTYCCLLIFLLLALSSAAEQNFRDDAVEGGLDKQRNAPDSSTFEPNPDACGTQYFVLPPGKGVVMWLPAPRQQEFQVEFRAVPTERTAGGVSKKYPPMHEWFTDLACGGSGLQAAALRKDELPVDVTDPRNSIRVVKPRKHELHFMQQYAAGCNTTLKATLRRNCQQIRGSTRTFDATLLTEHDAAFHLSDKQLKRLRDKRLLTGWPADHQRQQPGWGQAAPADACLAKHVELLASNITLTVPGRRTTIRKECMRYSGAPTADIWVFVHNCFQQQGTDMLVQARIVPLQALDGPIDCGQHMKERVGKALTVIVSAMGLAIVLCVFILLPSDLKKWTANRRNPRSAHRAKTRPDAHQDAARLSCVRLWWLAVRAMRVLHNPSGYSRLYTVTVTTGAALLVASIVWAPKLTDMAWHDTFEPDVSIIPRRATEKPGAVLYDEPVSRTDALEYFAKIMLLSLVIGHTVKLALLFNLSPPGPASKGVTVIPGVWRVQVAFAAVGLLLLNAAAVMYTWSLVLQGDILRVSLAHWYMQVVQCGNLLVASVCFVRYAFIRPPPLTSAGAREAASRAQLTSTQQKPAPQQQQPAPDAQQPSGFQGLWAKVCGLPAAFKEAVWEDSNFRYSSWVLTSVWLTILLVVFWWLTAVVKADVILECLSKPAACLPKTLQGPAVKVIATYKAKTEDFLQATDDHVEKFAELSATADTLLAHSQQIGSQMPADAKHVFGGLSTLHSNLYSVRNALDDYESARDELRRLVEETDKAALVGRWIGYSAAACFAMLSLFNIIVTFKRVLLYEVFLKKDEQGQAEMVADMAAKHNTALARVLSATHCRSLRRADTLVASDTVLERSSVAPTLRTAVTAPVTRRFRAEDDADASLRCDKGCGQVPSGWSEADEDEAKDSRQDNEVIAIDSKEPRALRNDSFCAHIAADIQRLEADMAGCGISSATALFAVTSSIMWIQIRVVGLAFALVMTVLCHPMFWRSFWYYKWYAEVLIPLAILIFNMVVVRFLIGDTWLSDGTNIKHPSRWMTFYIMFQLGYMVVGVLFALWRVVLALGSMLLFTVSALDRSLLLVGKWFDGPYYAFVASVKLEVAYMAIAEQDAEAEAQQDRTAAGNTDSPSDDVENAGERGR